MLELRIARESMNYKIKQTMHKDGNQKKLSPLKSLSIHFIKVKMLIERDSTGPAIHKP